MERIELKPNEKVTTNQNSRMDAFIFELGNRANKVEILHREDNSIEVKPKGYLGMKIWREINEILLRNGFEWLSSDRDSCWIKIKQVIDMILCFLLL